jgi:chromosome segregation ATPase
LEAELTQVRADLAQAEAGSVDALAQRARITELEEARDTALTNAARLSDELAAAESNLADRQEQIETLDVELAQLRASNDKNAGFVSALQNELSNTRSAATAEQESLVVRITELEEAIRDADSSGEVAEMIVQRDQALAEVSRLEQALAESDADRSSQAEIVSELQVALTEARQEGSESET